MWHSKITNNYPVTATGCNTQFKFSQSSLFAISIINTVWESWAPSNLSGCFYSNVGKSPNSMFHTLPSCPTNQWNETCGLWLSTCSLHRFLPRPHISRADTDPSEQLSRWLWWLVVMWVSIMISYLISCVSGLQHHKILYIVIELLFIIWGEVINIAIAKPLSTHRAGACVEFIYSVAVITFYSEGLKKKKKIAIISFSFAILETYFVEMPSGGFYRFSFSTVPFE